MKCIEEISKITNKNWWMFMSKHVQSKWFTEKFILKFPFDQARMKLEKLSYNKYPQGKCFCKANLNFELNEHTHASHSCLFK